MAIPSPPPREAFTISSRQEADRTVIAVTGELDIATVPELDRALAEAMDAVKPIVIDLAGCTFIDSTAITSLLRCYRSLAGTADGRPAAGLTVANAQGQVRRMLELTQVDEVIHLAG